MPDAGPSRLLCVASAAGALVAGVTTTPDTPPGAATDVVAVDTSEQLRHALADAGPGDVIELAPGRYDGRFAASVDGTADAPITLRGPRAAVLDGGDHEDGYGLHLDDADHWRLDGFTVTNSQKGVMADDADHNVIDGLYVHHIGEEAVHLRTHSTDNVVRGARITDTGLENAEYGEGIYIGSAVSNWGEYTDGDPDRSDRNQAIDNVIGPQVTAEHIDVKEGTRDGVIRGNIFDGRGMRGADYNDSWVDVKGNGYRIQGNVGMYAVEDGFQTHAEAEGWGRANVFAGNYADVRGPGYGVSIHRDCPDDPACGNVVRGDNVVQRAESGLTNISVTPALTTSILGPYPPAWMYAWTG